MKIFGITNNLYKQVKTPQNTTFCGDYNKFAYRNKIDRKKFYEDNFNDAYNIEYEPLDYEKYFPCEVEPEELPSQKYINKNSTFRDEELFNNKTDIKYYYGPGKYDVDDIPVRPDLWMDIESDYAKLYHCELDSRIPRHRNNPYSSVHRPWLTLEKIADIEKEMKYKNKAADLIQQIKKTDQDTINDIFKSTTLLTDGELKVNSNLCDLAILLYENSKQWTKTERNILNKIKTNFFQSNYTSFSVKKYDTILYALLCEKSNEEILEILKMKYSNYCDFNLRSIFTKEELKDLFS